MRCVCGYELKGTEKFCPKCGAPNYRALSASPVETTAKLMVNRRIIGMIVVAVAALLMVFFAGRALLGGGNTPEKAAERMMKALQKGDMATAIDCMALDADVFNDILGDYLGQAITQNQIEELKVAAIDQFREGDTSLHYKVGKSYDLSQGSLGDSMFGMLMSTDAMKKYKIKMVPVTLMEDGDSDTIILFALYYKGSYHMLPMNLF